MTGSFAQIGDSIRIDVSLYAQDGSLKGTETLTVDKPERLLTEVDLLSLKLANRLGARSEKPEPLVAVMTDDLEAYVFTRWRWRKYMTIKTPRRSSCWKKRSLATANL